MNKKKSIGKKKSTVRKKVTKKEKVIIDHEMKNTPELEVFHSEAVNKEEIKREYSLGHEIANAVTHGIGGGLSIAGLSVLVTFAVLQGDAWRVVSSAIYGATLVILYLASTLYHGIHHWGAKKVFQIIDHAAIYLLIAGTYTPFTLVSLRENSSWGWILFGTIWGLAILGVLFKTVFPGRFNAVSLVVYLIMGWLCLFALGDIQKAIGVGGMAWLVAGGISYTSGVIFYIIGKIPFNHAIWHLFVLGGSICHFFAILLYVIKQKS